MASDPESLTAVTGYHSSRWYKNHPEAKRPPRELQTKPSAPKKSRFGLGRAIAASAGLLLMSVASQIALAKGWADVIPDQVVIALYLIALLPVGYWVVSHNRLLRQRSWIGTKFKTRPHTVGGAIALVCCIFLISITKVSSIVLLKVAKHKQNEAVVSNLGVVDSRAPLIIEKQRSEEAPAKNIEQAAKQEPEKKNKSVVPQGRSKPIVGFTLENGEDNVVHDIHVNGFDQAFDFNGSKRTKINNLHANHRISKKADGY